VVVQVRNSGAVSVVAWLIENGLAKKRTCAVSI